MSEVQEQIKRNRADKAIQDMNKTLAGSEAQPGCTTVPGNELPIFGEPIQKHVQNLKPGADK